MGEVNRLEARLERERDSNKNKLEKLQNAINSNKSELEKALGQREELLKHVNILKENQGNIAAQLQKNTSKLNNSSLDKEIELSKIQRKLVKDVLVELLTPIKQNMNVDLKNMRKVLEESMSEVFGLKEKQNSTMTMVEEINTSILRMLKN